MARGLAPLLAAIAVCACGASPTSPVPTEPFRLSVGPHTLTIAISQTTSTNSTGITTSTLVCAGSGPTAVSIPVDVSRDGATWIARLSTGTLLARFSEVPGGVEGSMEGTGAHAGISVIVNNGDSTPAKLPRAAFSGVGVGGPIDGLVRFFGAQGEKNCSSNAWSLVPRS